ncbi:MULTISPECIES: hypothetical protein [unclassified Microcoleus]|uniref:hypothetical protein n=1 Tax=unclassified Microcoleus TaxID=2642155 RepID=UPI002FD3FAB9
MIYNLGGNLIERAAVQFSPVEEFWVNPNWAKRAIAILEIDRGPSRKDCCKMQLNSGLREIVRSAIIKD